ncbi:MICOS complex subunit MIC60 [Halotydeus destructor]|nr:MICOS complex subunit MIC60 [Halotydeus destructor]
MLRTPLSRCYAKSIAARKCPVPARCQSSSTSSSGGKTGLVIAGTAVTAIGATLAYAKYDLSFRSQIEDTVPYADKALNAVIGDKPTTTPPIVPSKVPLAKPTAAEPSLLQKKLARENEKAKSEAAAEKKPSPPETNIAGKSSPVAPLPPPPLPTIEKPPEKINIPPSNESKSADKSQSNSPLVGDSTRTLARQEEMKKKAEREEAKEKVDEKKVDIAALTEKRDDSKDELREQLKLQLSAYTDYLKEQLQLQRQELSREHQVNLEERLLHEKMRYQAELASSIARLQEIERVLQVREKLDAAEQKSRQLWLVCQILTDALKSNPADSVSTAPRSILNEIEGVISKVSDGEPNSLSQLALNAIPKNVLVNGVYTEDALVARFEKIDKLAKRVSLIGDEGGSLWRYMLSYVQSVLILDWSKISKEELEDKAVDPSQWDTYAILTRVRHCLKERNLEMSLRYANQLKGEPRKVAADWIKDVRQHLETRQSANILLAQAASVSVRTTSN